MDEPFVDSYAEPNPELNRITNAIIGAAIEVNRRLGPGLLESFYQAAMEIELEHRGIAFVRQHVIDVTYRNQSIGKSVVDLLVENAVVVELKAVEALNDVHRAQMICYLKVTKKKLDLIINFNVALLRKGIIRIAN
jgi:GxxExxY protein